MTDGELIILGCRRAGSPGINPTGKRSQHRFLYRHHGVVVGDDPDGGCGAQAAPGGFGSG